MNKYIKLSLFSFMLIPMISFAGNRKELTPYKRSVLKVFTVSNNARLSIDNKYGNINLHTWDKNEIKAVIEIDAEGNDLEDAKEVANQVNIQSSQSGNSVSLQTEYNAHSGSSFWKQFFGGVSNRGKRNIHINYEVYVPQSLADMNIANNYGNVSGDGLPGNISLTMNYGNFHIQNIAGNIHLHTNYCEGSLHGVKKVEVQANYTDFNLDQIDHILIHSNYSDYRINQVGNIDIHSNYGDITADNIGNITSHTTYGDYKIKTLLFGGNISTTYGDVNIKAVGDHFSGLKVNPTYSDINIGIVQSKSLRLDIELTRGDIHTGNISFQKKNQSDEHGSQVLKAITMGAGVNAPLIQISGSYSDVSLSEK